MNYMVCLKASDVKNYGQEWYSQKWEAWLGDKLVAEFYDSNHKAGMKYYTIVLQKNVNSKSGTSAIIMFRKWQDGKIKDTWGKSEDVKKLENKISHLEKETIEIMDSLQGRIDTLEENKEYLENQLQEKDKVIEGANSLILKINKYAEISDDRFAGYSDTIYIETEKWINKYKEVIK